MNKNKFNEFLDSLALCINNILSSLSSYEGIKLWSINLDYPEYFLIPFTLPELTLLEFKKIVLDSGEYNSIYKYKYIYIFNYRGEHVCDCSFDLDVINSLKKEELNDILTDKLETLINLSITDVNNISWFPWFPVFPYVIFYMHVSDKDIFHNKTNWN